jgi:hypothetical protein
MIEEFLRQILLFSFESQQSQYLSLQQVAKRMAFVKKFFFEKNKFWSAMTFSKDLRKRVIQHQTDGATVLETSTFLKISTRTVNRIRACHETHGMLRNPYALIPGRPRTCDSEIIEV